MNSRQENFLIGFLSGGIVFSLLFTFVLPNLIPYTAFFFVKKQQNYNPNGIEFFDKNKRKTLSQKLYFKDLSGENFELSSLRNGRKLAIVNIWATYCQPCKKNMPKYEKLVAAYSDKVTFVFLSKESIKKISKFAQKNKINLPLFSHNKLSFKLPKELEGDVIPRTYILRENILLAKNIGKINWENKNVLKNFEKLIQNPNAF